MVLTTVISPAFKVSREVTADWSAGMASAKSFSQSSLIVRKIEILGARECIEKQSELGHKVYPASLKYSNPQNFIDKIKTNCKDIKLAFKLLAQFEFLTHREGHPFIGGKPPMRRI